MKDNASLEPKRWQRVGFIVVAILFALMSFIVLEGATEALEPWIPSDCAGCNKEFFVPDSYRWLAASHGGLLAFLFGGSLIALLRRPFEKPVLLHFYAVGHLIFLAALAITAPTLALQKAFVAVIFLLTLAILYTFYHNRRAAVRLSPPAGYSRPLLALTVVAAAILVPVAVHAGIQQFNETGDQFRWGEHGALLIAMLYAGFLASARRTGARALAIIVSLTYAYVGAASLALPAHPGSWGIAGGAAAILYGAIFTAVSFGQKQLR